MAVQLGAISDFFSTSYEGRYKHIKNLSDELSQQRCKRNSFYDRNLMF